MHPLLKQSMKVYGSQQRTDCLPFGSPPVCNYHSYRKMECQVILFFEKSTILTEKATTQFNKATIIRNLATIRAWQQSMRIGQQSRPKKQHPDSKMQQTPEIWQQIRESGNKSPSKQHFNPYILRLTHMATNKKTKPIIICAWFKGLFY